MPDKLDQAKPFSELFPQKRGCRESGEADLDVRLGLERPMNVVQVLAYCRIPAQLSTSGRIPQVALGRIGVPDRLVLDREKVGIDCSEGVALPLGTGSCCRYEKSHSIHVDTSATRHTLESEIGRKCALNRLQYY